MESILSYINMQQIINFITVVEQKGFQAASDHLHLTQAAVSKSIFRLEETLGFPLFKKEQKGSRTFRDTELTEQGKYLYEYWAPAIKDIENAYEHILAIKDDNIRTVRVGYGNTTNPDLYLWPLLERFSALSDSPPSFQVESNYRSSLIQGLNNELYDIVFIPDVEYYSINQVIMDFQYAAIGNAQLIVPKTNHLYQKESVEIEELDGESIFLFADGTSDSPQKVLREFFNREEIIPHYKLLHKDAFNINNSFFEANAIILIDCFFSGSKGAGIRQIPLNGYFNGILCVWKKNTHKEKYIRQFSEVLKEICEIPIELLPVVDI